MKRFNMPSLNGHCDKDFLYRNKLIKHLDEDSKRTINFYFGVLVGSIIGLIIIGSMFWLMF